MMFRMDRIANGDRVEFGTVVSALSLVDFGEDSYVH